MNNKITIMGSGNTGLSTALKMKNDGHKVCLFELPEFSESLGKNNTEFKLNINDNQINLKLDLITTNVVEAISFSKIIIICVPAYAHKEFAKSISNKISSEHLVVLMPGTLGSLEFKTILKKNSSEIPILGETDTSPFVCRKINNNEATILGEVPSLGVAINPKEKTQAYVDKLNSFFHGLISYKDVIMCGLSSLNPVVHPAGVILNSGRIEKSNGEFYFYNEGLTESVVRVINSVDSERKNIANHFGHEIDSVADAFHNAGFGIKGDLLETISSSKMLTSLKAPGVVNHRWLTEDISYGIYTWSLLGKKFNIETHTMETLVEMGSILLGIDLKINSRNLDSLGLSDLDISEINDYI